MKIKTWLFASYLIVMILPLIAAYGLFAWINAYHKDLEVKDYVEKSVELQNIIKVVENPKLYQVGQNYEELDALASTQVEINLYLKEGFLLYTSNPIQTTSDMLVNTKTLYEDLYSFNQEYGAYTYKAPVLDGSNVIGFYKVKLARSEWVTGVSNMTWIVVGLFCVIFIFIFGGVVYFVNRKLGKPLKQLIHQMHTFAKNDDVTPIRYANDEIGELAFAFDDMREQLLSARAKILESQKEKEYMIASISHDLKTPLTSIRAYAESLMTTEQDRNGYTKIIVDKSTYMKQMIDDLLMYTLLQSPDYQMNIVEVEANEFFEMLLSDYEVLCSEKGISLKTMCTVDGIVALDPNQMLRVMDNLMSNALKFTKRNGEIVLAAVNVTDHLDYLHPYTLEKLTFTEGMYLIVQNTGEGIQENELENVFKPMYQTDRARTKVEHTGTGLGLNIAKNIVEKHGGHIQIASTLTKGTSIICWLPKKGDMENEMDKNNEASGNGYGLIT